MWYVCGGRLDMLFKTSAVCVQTDGFCVSITENLTNVQ